MFLKIVSYIPVILCLYGIGFLTLLKNTRNRVNIYFSLFTFFLATWLLTLFVADAFLDPQISLWALRIGSLLGCLTLPPLLFFCLLFPVHSKRLGYRFGIGFSIPIVVLGVLALTPS